MTTRLQIQWRRLIAIGVAVALLICLLVYIVENRSRYSRRDAQEGEVRKAEEIIRRLASDPQDLQEHVSVDITTLARGEVQESAALMAKATSLEVREASRFGDFLRVGVAGKLQDGRPIERWFIFATKNGKLHITGVQK